MNSKSSLFNPIEQTNTKNLNIPIPKAQADQLKRLEAFLAQNNLEFRIIHRLNRQFATLLTRAVHEAKKNGFQDEEPALEPKTP